MLDRFKVKSLGSPKPIRTREFFRLEDLWGDAGFERFEDLG
ncbi:MAG: hypothetical protein AAFS00_11375 [Bacteroidota bacterium]